VWLWFEEESLAKAWEAEPTGKRGAQPKYSDTVIQTVRVLKAIFGLTNRSVEGFVNSLWGRLGYELTSPDHTLISRRARTLTVQIPRRQRHEALHVVIDSTGLKVYGEGEWKVRQHGKSKRRVWRKVHVGVETDSREIVTVQMSGSNVHEADVFPELLEQMDFPVEQVSADGAYDTRKVYDKLAERGIRGAIPPRDGAVHWEAEHPRNATLEVIAKNGWRTWAKETN
jgi:IS5 family transposase